MCSGHCENCLNGDGEGGEVRARKRSKSPGDSNYNQEKVKEPSETLFFPGHPGKMDHLVRQAPGTNNISKGLRKKGDGGVLFAE